MIDLTTKLRFGKYKDITFQEIVNKDFEYVLWLFKNKVVALDKDNPGLYYFTKKYLTDKHTEYINSKTKI